MQKNIFFLKELGLLYAQCPSESKAREDGPQCLSYNILYNMKSNIYRTEYIQNWVLKGILIYQGTKSRREAVYHHHSKLQLWIQNTGLKSQVWHLLGI